MCLYYCAKTRAPGCPANNREPTTLSIGDFTLDEHGDFALVNVDFDAYAYAFRERYGAQRAEVEKLFRSDSENTA